MEDEKEFDSYVAYEVLYKNKMIEKNKGQTLFPDDWYLTKNYRLKSEILMEAIDKDILISDTQKYQAYIN